jgi:hypothetical protein
MMPPVKVVEAHCGKGKTSWAIEFMNANAEDRNWIFITPYLDEVDRIKTECGPYCFFEQPEATSRRSKSEHLKELLRDGENIVSTHKLFSMADEETTQLIKEGGYTLILDEAMEVVHHVPIKKGDVDILVSAGAIEILPSGVVTVPEDAPNYDSERFKDIISDAKMNRLVYVAESMMMWRFPIDVFKAFDETYAMSFIFDGQVQKRYFDAYGVPHEYFTVTGDRGNYHLIPYDEEVSLSGFKGFVREHVNIYKGRLNKIGQKDSALSVSWFEKATKVQLNKLGDAIRNFHRTVCKVNGDEAGWCVFGDYTDKVKPKSYINGHITHNIRASNEYRHRTSMAYCVNKYPRVPEDQFFKHIKQPLDWDRYALAEMIQWVWRSAIRDGKKIDLFVPSSRMRRIFMEFFEYPEVW